MTQFILRHKRRESEDWKFIGPFDSGELASSWGRSQFDKAPMVRWNVEPMNNPLDPFEPEMSDLASDAVSDILTTTRDLRKADYAGADERRLAELVEAAVRRFKDELLKRENDEAGL